MAHSLVLRSWWLGQANGGRQLWPASHHRLRRPSSRRRWTGDGAGGSRTAARPAAPSAVARLPHLSLSLYLSIYLSLSLYLPLFLSRAKIPHSPGAWRRPPRQGRRRQSAPYNAFLSVSEKSLYNDQETIIFLISPAKIQ